jgi:prepilin peptidase CpaA
MGPLACTLLLLSAVWWDVKTHRIPNQLVLLGLLVGWLSSLLPAGIGWQDAALGSLAGLVAFLPLYLLRILGAGDVKLLAAVGAFVGYPGVLTVALLSGLAGGVLALFMAIRHRQLTQIWQQVQQGLIGFVMQIASGGRPRQWVMVVGPHRLPYAMAIALGTLGYVYIKN